MLRESLPTLKRTLLVTFNELLDKGFRQYIKDFNQQSLTLTWSNGSQIIFMAESYEQDKELNRFRGLEINGAFLDEVNEMQEITLNKVIERSGSWFHSTGCPTKILASCNPTHTWVKERFYDKWVNNNLPEGVAYIPAKIFDNPHIPAEYLESLKMLPDYEYEVFVNGNWELSRNSEMTFITELDETKHVANIEYNNNYTLLVSIDFNINPFCAIFAYMYRDAQGEHLRIFREVEIMNGSIDKMAYYLKDNFNMHNAYITGDSMGNNRSINTPNNWTYYEQLCNIISISYKNLNVPPNPTHQNSRSDCNFALKNFDIQIDKNCKGLLRDMRNVKVDNYGSIIKQNRKDINQRADFLDNFRYLINTFMKKSIDNKMKMIRK